MLQNEDRLKHLHQAIAKLDERKQLLESADLHLRLRLKNLLQDVGGNAKEAKGVIDELVRINLGLKSIQDQIAAEILSVLKIEQLPENEMKNLMRELKRYTVRQRGQKIFTKVFFA